MNNTKHYWKLNNYKVPVYPGADQVLDGTYDLMLDEYWIEIYDKMTGDHTTIKVSPNTGKPMYSYAYALYIKHTLVESTHPDYIYQVWIEPAVRMVGLGEY
jgi:hypothetical protein